MSISIGVKDITTVSSPLTSGIKRKTLNWFHLQTFTQELQMDTNRLFPSVKEPVLAKMKTEVKAPEFLPFGQQYL